MQIEGLADSPNRWVNCASHILFGTRFYERSAGPELDTGRFALILNLDGPIAFTIACVVAVGRIAIDDPNRHFHMGVLDLPGPDRMHLKTCCPAGGTGHFPGIFDRAVCDHCRSWAVCRDWSLRGGNYRGRIGRRYLAIEALDKTGRPDRRGIGGGLAGSANCRN